MWKQMKSVLWLVVLSIPLLATRSVSVGSPGSPAPQSVSLCEAEILVYLLPQAHDLRADGMDVAWALETGPELNQKDFYNFWVVNAKRKGHSGSVTVGYFSVNKYTADVLDARQQYVVTPELQGVQRILRKGHGIDEAAIREYRSRRMYLTPPAPTKP